jgi:hypothetical protein
MLSGMLQVSAYSAVQPPPFGPGQSLVGEQARGALSGPATRSAVPINDHSCPKRT